MVRRSITIRMPEREDAIVKRVQDQLGGSYSAALRRIIREYETLQGLEAMRLLRRFGPANYPCSYPCGGGKLVAGRCAGCGGGITPPDPRLGL